MASSNRKVVPLTWALLKEAADWAHFSDRETELAASQGLLLDLAPFGWVRSGHQTTEGMAHLPALLLTGSPASCRLSISGWGPGEACPLQRGEERMGCPGVWGNRSSWEEKQCPFIFHLGKAPERPPPLCHCLPPCWRLASWPLLLRPPQVPAPRGSCRTQLYSSSSPEQSGFSSVSRSCASPTPTHSPA